MNGRVAPARQAAFRLLLELDRRPDAHAGDLLRGAEVNGLSPADRNLVTTLVMGVLRWRIALDRHIAAFVNSGYEGMAAPVRTALEMGALQLLLLDRIPAHAAIFESVELVKHSGNPRAAGLVNAVLRKLTKSPRLDHSPLASETATALAQRYAHPEWLVERWAAAYGFAAARDICVYNQAPPPVTIRLDSPQAEDLLRDEGVETEAAWFVTSARRVVRGDVIATEAYRRRLIRIQDEGSQLIAEAAGKGTVILDCCAAPGGKTAILAQRNPGAAIDACEPSLKRREAMMRLLDGLAGITYHAVDARRLPFGRRFDLVLCDAPCSGTGTLGRNPEIRLRLSPAALVRQRERQLHLLRAAMNALLPGGRLIYSTCSLEAEENEGVVTEALEEEKECGLLQWPDWLHALEQNGILHPGSAEKLFPAGSPADFLRTIPGRYPGDGYFAACITRGA